MGCLLQILNKLKNSMIELLYPNPEGLFYISMPNDTLRNCLPKRSFNVFKGLIPSRANLVLQAPRFLRPHTVPPHRMEMFPQNWNDNNLFFKTSGVCKRKSVLDLQLIIRNFFLNNALFFFSLFFFFKEYLSSPYNHPSENCSFCLRKRFSGNISQCLPHYPFLHSSP